MTRGIVTRSEPEGAQTGAVLDAEATPVATRHRRAWPWIVVALLTVLLVGGVVAGAFAMQFWSEAQRARAAVERAAAGIESLRADFDAADTAQLRAVTDEVQANVTLAVRTVDGPLWDIAMNVLGGGGGLPLVGDVLGGEGGLPLVGELLGGEMLDVVTISGLLGSL